MASDTSGPENRGCTLRREIRLGPRLAATLARIFRRVQYGEYRSNVEFTRPPLAAAAIQGR
jgi:hypothetical protein